MTKWNNLKPICPAEIQNPKFFELLPDLFAITKIKEKLSSLYGWIGEAIQYYIRRIGNPKLDYIPRLL